ncbi:MAG: LPS export ABC transporter permease LptG [Candidatus Eisenbacteria bacterium]
MIRLLDRHVIRGYLFALLAALSAFIAIFVILDLFEKLDDFLDRGVPILAVLQYYVYRIPEILLLMLPVGMLLACLFALGAHARNNEFVATTSAGISMRRTLMPVVILAFFMSAAALLLGETIAPPAAARVKEIHDGLIKPGGMRADRVRTNLSYLGEGGRLFWVGRLDTARDRMEDVVVQKLAGNTLLERIDAEEADWEAGVWTFRRGYFRRFEEGVLAEARRFEERAEPAISETPGDLAEVQKNPRQMSHRELSAYIDRASSSGGEVQREQVDLHMKVAFPFTSFLIVLLGSPLSALLRRGGNAVGFTLALLICFVYYMAIRVGQSFGYNGVLPPLLAAWIANLLFFALGLFLFRKLANK